jgi:hypothetical protein
MCFSRAHFYNILINKIKIKFYITAYSLQLFTSTGDFVCVVRGLPRDVFVTDLHVTSDYRLMVMQRHAQPCVVHVGQLGPMQVQLAHFVWVCGQSPKFG